MNLKKQKIILLIFVILFVLFLIIFIFNNNLNISINKYKFDISYKKTISEISKVIIIGDSRMELIEIDKEKLNVPTNFIFDAESGAKISWLYSVGIPKLYKIINNKSNYKYKVIFNLGVNDLNDDIDIKQKADEYFNTYKNIIESNKNIFFYFLSVNPVDENRIYKYFSKENKRTNNKIEKFNNYFIKMLKKEKLKNVKYCDSYNTLDFELPDGLHYNFKTNNKIIKYLIEECINLY